MLLSLHPHQPVLLQYILSQLRHALSRLWQISSLMWIHSFYSICVPLWCITDPGPPTGVQAVAGTVCNTSDVSWSPSRVNYGAASLNYSVRYQLRDSNDIYTTVYSSSTNVTLRGFDPSAVYDVVVVAVDSCGRQSGSSDVAQLNLQGNSGICLQHYLVLTYIQILWNLNKICTYE